VPQRDLAGGPLRAVARGTGATGREDGSRRPEPGRIAERLRTRHRPVPAVPAGAGAGGTARAPAQRSGPARGRGTVRSARRRHLDVAAELFARWQAHIEACLEACLPDPSLGPRRLHEAMRHAVLGGGKRMRPLLVYATGTLLQAESSRLDAAACAVEL